VQMSVPRCHVPDSIRGILGRERDSVDKTRLIVPPFLQCVMVDCEHGNIDDQEMYHSVGAIASAGASPIVRTAGAEPFMIKRAIDCGAHAIMIPQCETKVIQSCFPGLGCADR